MRIEQVELRIVRLPLARPFQTSSSRKSRLDHILVKVVSDGLVGWGECACPSDPYYCPETTETCWHILHDFLVPSLMGKSWSTIDQATSPYAPVKGNAFAKAGLEMACWDLLGRSQGKPLHELLGATQREIRSGVSLGIERDIEALIEQVDRHQALGYHRIKLKIAPGWDVEIARRVRERYPDLPLQVDANSAYTLDDLPTMRALDDLNLILIEQPLAHDDIVDHARLQAQLKTPICLDESIHSAADARKAIDLGSCRVINIKVSRLGGLLESKRVHDICRDRGIPVWCGGMHEFGIGRAANVAIAGLPGFTIPGDVSGSDRYYDEDLVEPPILAHQGAIRMLEGPGLGVEPVIDRLEKRTLRRALLKP